MFSVKKRQKWEIAITCKQVITTAGERLDWGISQGKV